MTYLQRDRRKIGVLRTKRSLFGKWGYSDSSLALKPLWHNTRQCLLCGKERRKLGATFKLAIITAAFRNGLTASVRPITSFGRSDGAEGPGRLYSGLAAEQF